MNVSKCKDSHVRRIGFCDPQHFSIKCLLENEKTLQKLAIWFYILLSIFHRYPTEGILFEVVVTLSASSVARYGFMRTKKMRIVIIFRNCSWFIVLFLRSALYVYDPDDYEKTSCTFVVSNKSSFIVFNRVAIFQF